MTTSDKIKHLDAFSKRCSEDRRQLRRLSNMMRALDRHMIKITGGIYPMTAEMKATRARNVKRSQHVHRRTEK